MLHCSSLRVLTSSNLRAKVGEGSDPITWIVPLHMGLATTHHQLHSLQRVQDRNHFPFQNCKTRQSQTTYFQHLQRAHSALITLLNSGVTPQILGYISLISMLQLWFIAACSKYGHRWGSQSWVKAFKGHNHYLGPRWPNCTKLKLDWDNPSKNLWS